MHETGLTIEQVQVIEARLARLRTDTQATSIMLVDTSGQLLCGEGALEDLDTRALSALVAGNFLATSEIGRLLGERDAFKVGYHEGEKYNLYSAKVEAGTFLVVIFRSNIRAGMVWFCTKQAIGDLLRIFTEYDVYPQLVKAPPTHPDKRLHGSAPQAPKHSVDIERNEIRREDAINADLIRSIRSELDDLLGG